MSNDVIITQVTHDQVIQLLDQLIDISEWQDSESKKENPTKAPGESFMTNKLKLIKKTLKNEN